LRHTGKGELNHEDKTLPPELLHKIDAYWRAANYLPIGQIYLYDNPLLKEPLKLSHAKPTLSCRMTWLMKKIPTKPSFLGRLGVCRTFPT